MESAGRREISSYPAGVARAGHSKSSIWCVDCTRGCELIECSYRIDGPQSQDLLRPVFMGCATKNAKVVAISLGSLQRLISLKAVPQSAVPLIINTMNDAMSQGVDIQLRILQTLVSLVPNFPAIHGDLLGDVRVTLTFGRDGDLTQTILDRRCCCASSCRSPASR